MARHGTLPETSRTDEPEVETVPLAHGRDAVDTPRRFAGDPPVCPHTVTNYIFIRVIRPPKSGERATPTVPTGRERSRSSGPGCSGRTRFRESGSAGVSGPGLARSVRVGGPAAVGTLSQTDQPVDRGVECRMGLPEQPGRVNRASGVGEQGRPPGTPGLGQRLGRELRGCRSGGW